MTPRDEHRSSPTRTNHFWLGISLRFLTPLCFLLIAFALMFGAVIASGLLKIVWAVGALVPLGCAWGFAWRISRHFNKGQYLAQLQPGADAVKIPRTPHAAIAGTVGAVAPVVIAVAFTAALNRQTAATYDTAVVAGLWLLALSACAYIAHYWRRSRIPMIVTAQGLTDRTARIDALAWSRIRRARLWAPKGDAIGIVFDIGPGPDWADGREGVTIGCLDLAARPEEVLAMFEAQGAGMLDRR